MNEDGTLLTSLEIFEKFGEYFASGLAPRIDGEIVSDGPEITNSDRDAIASLVTDGALLGRTIWGGEGAESTGCFLWVGSLGVLLGESDKTVSSLTDEEIATLDASLKLNIEEGCDEKPPVDWSEVERISAEDLPQKLKEIGVAEEFEIATLPIDVAGQKMSFLFLMSTEGGADDAAESVPHEAAETVPDDAAETVSDDAAETLSDEAAADEAISGEPDPMDEPVDEPIDAVAEAAAEADMAAAASLAVEEEAAAVTATTPEATPEPASGIPPELMKNLEHLLDVRLPLTIRLGATRIQLDELLQLTPGAILELDRREEEPLEVLANGQVVARGEVVVVDERFGLRITEIGSSEDRMRASL